MANNNNKTHPSSRSHLLQSQADFPSGLLRDSVQLRDTSAPFPDIPSDDDSVWPPNGHRLRNHEMDEDDADEVDVQLSHLDQSSTNSATPGPSRTQPRGESMTPVGPLRLKEVMHALDQVPRSSSRPSPPPQPRSEADSDILDSDEGRSYKESMKDVFKRAAMGSSFGDNAATPREKGRRLSFDSPSTSEVKELLSRDALSEDEGDMNNSQGSSVPFRRSNSKTFDLLRARLEDPTANPSINSTEHDQSPEHSPPPSPRVENLNESVVTFPTGPEYDTPITPSRPEEPSPSSRPRPASITGIARPRTSLLSNRNRPLSSYDKEYGEISFASGEVESSTPLRPKQDRQAESEHWDWTRPTLASLHKSQERSASPVETWEHQRERNWNNPKPKNVPDRPPSRQGSESASPHSTPGRQESYDPASPERSRVSSAASMSSVSSFNPPHGTRGKGAHSRMSPSPSPMSHSRSRTFSSPTAAEKLQEREKGWNRPALKSPSKTPSTTPARVRTNSMPASDAVSPSVPRAGHASPSPQPNFGSLGRARTITGPVGRAPPDMVFGGGRQTTGIPISAAARARGGVIAYQPVQPTSTLIRRSSLIGAVTEEMEPSQSDGDVRPPSPASTIPLPPSPGSSRSATPANDDNARSSTPQQTRMERDSSRLYKAMARSTVSPAPESTTPQMSPARALQQSTTTPQNTPPRPVQAEEKEQTLSTPSKRSFYEPKELTTPSPPKGGLPELPSFSDEEEEARKGEQDEVLQGVKEPVRGVVVPLRTFGRRSPVPKTPKFPGAWNTPGANGNSTIATPPFDDREHPHPKGEALDLKRYEDDITHSDSEIQSPTARPQQERQRAISTPQTPGNRPDQSIAGQTPAPPGMWLATPHPRKSIMKVRFDSPTRASLAKSISRPTTPDAVVDDTHKILQALVGTPSSSSLTSKDSDTPRRRARINMVDAFGRDLFASDGTPIKRDTNASENKENQDRNERRPLAPFTDDPYKPETSAVELHVTTPNKRRAVMRMVNSYGEEIVESKKGESDSRTQAVVDLTSPVDQPEVEDEWDSDKEHSLHENVPRVRKSLDGLWGSLRGDKTETSSFDLSAWTTEAHRERLAPLGDLGRTIEEATQKRLEAEKALKSVGYAEIPITELPSAFEPRIKEIPNTTKAVPRATTVIVDRSIPWTALAIAWLISIILFIVMLHWSGVVERKAEDFFLKTYHDAAFAGFYASGDPHAPTVSQWLMINGNNHQVSPSTYHRITSWFGVLAYDLFGSTLFLDTSFRPNFVPT